MPGERSAGGSKKRVAPISGRTSPVQSLDLFGALLSSRGIEQLVFASKGAGAVQLAVGALLFVNTWRCFKKARVS